MSTIKWSYGVTTVPARRDTLLPQTLASLKSAGFDSPRLFVDGIPNSQAQAWEDRFGLSVTARWPAIRTYGNWFLALVELYHREPHAERYAIFQDDLLTYPNLRAYLDQCRFPDKGYWNLFTFPRNQKKVPPDPTGQRSQATGWFRSDQTGQGAVGLVFNLDGVRRLLAHQHMIDRVQDPLRGYRNLDGGIITAMISLGYTEFIHNPSLIYHTGAAETTTQGNAKHPQTLSFRDESFDALKLIDEQPDFHRRKPVQCW